MREAALYVLFKSYNVVLTTPALWRFLITLAIELRAFLSKSFTGRSSLTKEVSSNLQYLTVKSKRSDAYYEILL